MQTTQGGSPGSLRNSKSTHQSSLKGAPMRRPVTQGVRSRDQPERLLHDGMILVIDDPATEGDAQQFLQALLGEYRLGELSLGADRCDSSRPPCR